MWRGIVHVAILSLGSLLGGFALFVVPPDPEMRRWFA
jgi:hypothetical protein